LERNGKAFPGQTVEFGLTFAGIPGDVIELTLVMDNVRTEDGKSYDLRIDVPLPGSAPRATATAIPLP
jgi:hypothetical protein